MRRAEPPVDRRGRPLRPYRCERCEAEDLYPRRGLLCRNCGGVLYLVARDPEDDPEPAH